MNSLDAGDTYIGRLSSTAWSTPPFAGLAVAARTAPTSRILFLEGSAMRIGLLKRALRHADRRGYAERVLDATAVDRTGASHLSTLTLRYLDVLKLLAEGYSNQELANELGIGLPTIKTHLREIYARRGVSSRTQAVAIGRRRSLL